MTDNETKKKLLENRILRLEKMILDDLKAEQERKEKKAFENRRRRNECRCDY